MTHTSVTNFSGAKIADGVAIRKLLDEAELPSADVGDEFLRDFVVCYAAGDLIAVAGLQPCGEVALLRSVAVSRQHRGTKIGTQLLARVEERARLSHFQALYLLTTTAEQFFSRHGYRVVDRASAPESIRETEEFANICPSSSVCMVKTLEPASHI